MKEKEEGINKKCTVKTNTHVEKPSINVPAWEQNPLYEIDSFLKIYYISEMVRAQDKLCYAIEDKSSRTLCDYFMAEIRRGGGRWNSFRRFCVYLKNGSSIEM